MNPWKVIWRCLVWVVWLGWSPVAAQGVTEVRLRVGEVRVLMVPGVSRVAVGDGQVVQATAADDREVVVFARHPGDSMVHAWTGEGGQRQWRIRVVPADADERRRELEDVLARIPHVQVSRVGEHIVVEGDMLSDADRERVAALSVRHPELLDFTGAVGWDHMVLLDVQVVELPRSALRELGLRWQPAEGSGLHTGLAWDAGSRRLADRPADLVVPVPYPAVPAAGYFGVNALLSARIQALAQTGSAVVLAQPQLVARSGATAEFLAGGEVPYATTDAQGQTRTVFKPYGVGLKMTPRIERNGMVRSRIEVEVSAVDTSLAGEQGPALKTRRAVTEFNVPSGQTLVLAGFLSRDLSRQTDAVPGLGDVPLLGALFRASRRQRQDTELAIFVTPLVVTPDHPGLQHRVAQRDAVLASAFPDPPALMSPVSTRLGTVGSASWADHGPSSSEGNVYAFDD